MAREFAYCRVSTSEQTTDNQILALKAQGYLIQESRVISETISGGVPAKERPEFQTLLNYKLESGDSLIVLKLDRLGRDTIDVLQTVDALTAKGVKVRALDLGDTDLTSPAGKLHLTILSAVAEMEKGRLKERTKEGLERAKAQGKKLGRPEAIDTKNRVLECRYDHEMSQSKTAKHLNISLSTVKRHWNANNK
ncbi:recombinase family protein [Motilimonas sp. 1_MG-2023]|uniref:recombinase family protein n=1 Tax=Motilimonas sp. 1_MG-2023 TaxID=3062672 RepID=UPI0026E347AA|nr:recombinase family protein [Motilimonas sp. 1_MG-2023]MDO6527923.1 recombinase family protein [Motilimonas sp. 1_MG-2023]